MKNYILAFMLVPFLLFGQRFKDKNSELIIKDTGGGEINSKSVAVEAVPRLLSYQGFLTVGGAGPVSDGQYTVNFRLFDQEEDGNEFWTETHLLTVSDGLVSALLGSKGFPIETVPMNSYLEIEIDGNTLSPRQQITSVMYAIKSDTTNYAKGYSKTADFSEVAFSGEYSDLLNSPDLTPFATKDSLGYYATLDSLDSYTLTSELSVVAFSGEYEDILNIPDLADYAVTDTLSYYATLDSLGYYVSEDSLNQYIGSTIQAYDTELYQIAELRDLVQGQLMVYDGTELTWTAQGGADARATLGLGEMAVQEPDSVLITGGSISGIEDIFITDGGTGASTSEGARDSLGLKIGEDVQAFDSDLQTIATQYHSENPNVKQMLISRGYYWEARSADSARTDLGLKIGEDVQAWNQDLQNFADGQDIPADNIQYGEYFINQPGQQGQIWASDASEEGRWSNLGEYLTYEVSGADTATNIVFDVDVGTGPNQVIALDVTQKLPAVNASRLEGITADQINDSTVSNSEFDMLAGIRTIPGEDGPGGLIQDQLDGKAQNGNNSDILSITGLTTMLAINQGGTGASNAEDARTNIDAQQKNVHLDDLAEDGILSASKVEYGTYFINDPGDAGYQWTSRGFDYGYWAPGGDIAHVYTDPGRGILINSAAVAEAGSVHVVVDAGLEAGQIPQLQDVEGVVGGSLPGVDGSQLTGLVAEQINASSEQPVTNAQFDLLTDLRTTSTADLAGGPIQSQLDDKQNQSIYLDDIVTASSGNVSDQDLLIWKVVDGDGSWELLKSDDATYNVTESRVEHGEFFINDAGINGQYWSSDGLERGGWRTYGPRFTVGPDTLNIRTGTNAGDIVELLIGGKLPAVDASNLLELNALQINDSTVSNAEFNALADLRLAGTPLPEANATEYRYQAGDIQVQLDGKMNYNEYLADLSDGLLTYDRVQYGEYFIQEPSDLAGKVWTWSGDQANGFGLWQSPPGAQWIGDLNDASTSPANSNNLFLGDRSGNNSTGENNVGVGPGSLASITSGTINVAVGTNAGTTIENGNANILIGYNAGSSLQANANNKLIIDNGNVGLGQPNPLIGGSFDVDRGITVDGSITSKSAVSTQDDIRIVDLGADNSVNSTYFKISNSSGDIDMTNNSEGQKINFLVDGSTTLLTMDGSDDMVKLPAEIKLASDDNTSTYINATTSGTHLNVMGETKVFVRGGDSGAGRIQLMAKDSLRLKSDFIEIDSPQEFIVQNDMRVGRDFRVGDVDNSELKISYDGSNDFTINNTKTDKDIIFKATPGGSNQEVMRVDGTRESLLMAENNHLEFRDDQTYINSSAANILDLVAPSLRLTSTSYVSVSNRLNVVDSLVIGTGANTSTMVMDAGNDLFVANSISNQDIIFAANKNGVETEMLRFIGQTTTTKVNENIELNSTADDANGVLLKLSKTKASNPAAAADVLGVIKFEGKADNDAAQEYAYIQAKIKDPAAASPVGALDYYIATEGNPSAYKFMDINSTQDSTLTISHHLDVGGKLKATEFVFRSDIYPNTAGAANIGTVDNEWGDVFLHDNKAIKFGSEQDATITHGSGSLTVLATNTDITNKLRVADEFLLGAGKDEFSITESSDDITIKNTVDDKDIIFSASTGAAAVEVLRLDGSASSLRMSDTKKLEFTDGDHYINNSGSRLDMVALDDGNIKIGTYDGGDASLNTAQVYLEATTVSTNSNNLTVSAPNETPIVTMLSEKDLTSSSASLVLKKARGGGVGVADDVLGVITAKGENDGDALIDYAQIKFESKDPTGGSERGSINFITKGTTGPLNIDGEIDLLMDINHTTAHTVTVHGDMSVAGSMSLNGAAFRDDITSDGRGVYYLGTETTGEWAGLNLHDADGSANITFGPGGDGASDVHLTYNGTAGGAGNGITINRDNRFEFRDASQYIHSSADDILNLVAPGLVVNGTDIYPNTAGGTNIGTVDNEWGDLFLHENKAIKFGSGQDATITHGSGSLTVLATNTDITNKLRVADEFLLGAGQDEFSITESSDDITIKNTVNDKDILFSASTGGNPVEIMRLDGDASSLLMAGETKLEFGVNTNYINVASSKLNVKSNNPLWMDVSSVKMSNDVENEDTDFTMTIEKEVAGETLQSDLAGEPLWKLENLNATAAQAGAIVEFKKGATQDDATMGSIKSSTGDGTFAQIDFNAEGATDSQSGSMIFTTYDATVAKQVMDLGATSANTVTIGTGSNAANLKVYGTLTAASTSYENDILPADPGVQHVGADGTEWGKLWLTEGGAVSFGDDADDVTLTQKQSNAGVRGLLLNGTNKIFFEDDNAATGLDQYIGSESSGVTALKSSGGLVIQSSNGALDLDGTAATIDAATGDIALTAAAENIVLTTPAAKKVSINPNTAAILSHTSNGDGQHFTIEQKEANNSSLKIASEGNGTLALELDASASGVSIDGVKASNYTVTGEGESLTLEAAGGGAQQVVINSAGTGVNAIRMNASAGGVDIDGIKSSNITVTTSGENLTLEAAGGGTQKVMAQSAGTAGDAIHLNATAGGIDVDAAGALTMDGGAVSIDGTATSNFTADGNGVNLTLEATGGGSQKVLAQSAGDGADAIHLNASAGGIEFSPSTETKNTGKMKIVAASNAAAAELYISADQDENPEDKWLVTATDNGVFSIANTDDGTTFNNMLTISATGQVTATGGFDGGLQAGDGDDVTVNATNATLFLKTTTSGEVDVTSAGAVDINADGGILSMDGTGINIGTAGDVAVDFNGAAIDIDAAAALTMDAAAASNLTTTAGDLTLTADAANAKVVIKGDHTGDVAVHIDANENPASEVLIDAGIVDVNASGALEMNSSAASNLTTSSGALTLEGAAGVTVTSTGGTLALNGTGNTVDLNGAAIDIDASGALTMDAADASNLTTSSGALTLEGAGGVTVTSTGGTLALNGATQTVDLDGDAIDIDASAVLALDGAGGINIGTAGDVAVDFNGAGIDVDASAALTMDAAAASNITVATDAIAEDLTVSVTGATNSSLFLSSEGTGDDAIALTASAGGMDITAAGVMDITTSAGNSNITVNPNGAGTLALGSASNTAVTIDAIALNLTAASGGSITIDADGGEGASEDVVIVGNNFSVTDAGVMNVAGALTAASFSGAMSSNALTTANQNLTVSTTTSGDIILDAVGDIDIDADGDEINMKFGGEIGHLSFSNGNDGDIKIKQEISGRKIIFFDEADVETFTIEDAATGIVVPGEVKTTKLSYTNGDDAITIASGGGVTFANVRATADAGIDVDNLELDNNSLISSSGALTLTSAAAATWSTGDGVLTLEGAGGVTVTSTNGTLALNGTGQTVDLNGAAIDIDASGALTMDAAGASNLTTSSGALTLDGAGGVNIAGNGTEIDLTAGSAIIELNSTNVDIKAATQAGSIRLYEASGDGSNYMEIKAPNLSGDGTNADFTLTLPIDDGVDGQVLSTNGSGVLSWETDATSASSVTNGNVFGANEDEDVSFTANTSEFDGVFKWMTKLDEDYWEFFDDILMDENEQISFGIIGNNIKTTATNLTVTTTASFNVDADEDITLDADGEDVFIKHNNDIYASLTKSSGTNDLLIKSGTTDAMEFTGAAVEAKGDITAAGGDGALTFSAGSDNSIKIPDNEASGLVIKSADAAAYMTFVTTDDNEAITFNKAVTFSGGIANGGTMTTTDINGGSIDGTVIGAANQAAGDFTAIGAVAPGTIVGTTITANTSLLPDAVGGADIGSVDAEWGDVFIADDKKIQFGDGQDATIEYDEDDTDKLRFAGDALFANDVTLSGDDGALKFTVADNAVGSKESLAIGPADQTNQKNIGFYWNVAPDTGQLIIASNNENQFIFADGWFKPAHDGDISLGGAFKKFTNGWFEGNLHADKLYLDDSNNDNQVIFSAHATTTSYTVKMPATKGTAGQILKINSVDGDNVNLDWAADVDRPEAPPTPNSSSDRRFKKNISTVSGALQKLSKLNPVNYDWRQDEFENKGFNDKKQWGFIAQEINEILPELVGKDDEDFLTLNYQGFVPLLTKAVQEQQEEIDSQQKEIDALKSQLQMIMDMLDNDMSDKTDSKKDNDNKKPVKLSMATQK